MKRCPECDFLYLDSDQFCDLDGAPLNKVEASITTAKIEGVPQSIRQGWKTFAMLIIPGLVFGAILFVVYNWVASQHRSLVTTEVPSLTSQPSPHIEPSPAGSATPTPEPSRTPVIKASPPKVASPSPTRLSSQPISTDRDKKEQQGMLIRLSDGRTIAADEAWRSKDGIWYRRNGVVTLLKRRQVKTIEKAP